MLYLLRLILLFILFASPALAADELESSVQRLMEQVRNNGAQLEIPVNKHQEEGIQAARESGAVYNSPEFQEKLRCERQRLREEVFSDYIQEPEQEMVIPGRLAENEKVYLFFSSSVPDETIHTYYTMVDGLAEPRLAMVMKGYVLGQDSHYLAQISRKDTNCVDQLQSKNPVICERFKIPIKIQPSLFDRFAISQVPAVVYERDEQAWKMSGDMRLDYLLERINRQAGSYGLEELITKLRGSR